MFLIEENLRNGFYRFTHGFFQVGFSDAFRVNIDVAEVEIITFFSQFFSQLFSAYAIRTARTPKNYCKHGDSFVNANKINERGMSVFVNHITFLMSLLCLLQTIKKSRNYLSVRYL
ncbi:hypothetical protein SRABI106_03893 [Rahnella aquatilis]|nr:hypothetical protein SRABI106_03893 [Rahnella aquatilis]